MPTKAMTCEEAQRWLVQKINPAATYEQLLSFPSFFEVETVHGCNARCGMCQAMKSQAPRGVMAEKLFVALAEEIALHAPQVRMVKLFRDGEPLLDPHLEERVGLMKALNIRSVSITSNMSLTTAERAERLLLSGLDQEMEARVSGRWRESAEEKRRERLFAELVAEFYPGYELKMRPSCRYLERNQALLEGR